MYFEELIDHLFNIKILANLDKYKSSITEYLNNIAASAELTTELNLKNKELNHKVVQQIIDKSGEVSFSTFEDKSKTEISNLLKEVGIEDPIFGSIGIELNNIATTIEKTEELKQYIFGKELVKNQVKDAKSNEEVLIHYTKLKEFQLTNNFIEHLRLLEDIKTPLKSALEHLKTELNKTIKNIPNEDKRKHIRDLNNDNQRVLKESPYLVVSNITNYDYEKDIELSIFLYNFSKSNSLDPNKLTELKQYYIALFFDVYLKQNFNHFLKTVLINEDEIFAIIQNRNSISQYVLPSHIVEFEKIEKQLIKEGYFDLSAKWDERNKTKKLLVEFILHCHSLAYFKIRPHITDNTELKKLRYFFESRYSIKITNQFKPNQRKSIELPSYEFRWIGKAF